MQHIIGLHIPSSVSVREYEVPWRYTYYYYYYYGTTTTLSCQARNCVDIYRQASRGTAGLSLYVNTVS